MSIVVGLKESSKPRAPNFREAPNSSLPNSSSPVADAWNRGHSSLVERIHHWRYRSETPEGFRLTISGVS